jgi:hypothetical protein
MCDLKEYVSFLSDLFLVQEAANFYQIGLTDKIHFKIGLINKKMKIIKNNFLFAQNKVVLSRAVLNSYIQLRLQSLIFSHL